MTAEIFALARAQGKVRPEEEDLLQKLCRAAEEELTGRLRPGVAAEDCAHAFTAACAWIALSGLGAARGGTDRVESFTAGLLTVKQTDGTGAFCRGRALRAAAERLMAPYLIEREFCFLGVRG